MSSQTTKSHKNNIALTGLMGSGKSTVGKHLAKVLQKEFIDTDELIEKQEGTSINDIFADKGEKYFRKIEAQILKDIFNRDGEFIISLGGGAIVCDDNRKLCKENSRLVALVAEPKELYERVKRRKNRPLLQGNVNQLEVLSKLWQERKAAYMDSHLQISTSDKSVNLVSNEIMKSLGLKKVTIKNQEVKIPRPSFNYEIAYGALSQINLDAIGLGSKILIVSQSGIAKHYLASVKEKLASKYEVFTMNIENGEEAKNFFTYQAIIQKLLSRKFERKDTVLALGGGVVGDICGFAASTYYRGIHYIQVPTTLLSMIDSSVGGKTAINVPEGKNLIGTFYQPHHVFIDSDNLKTLPEREFKSGLGELVKYTLLGAKWDSALGEPFFGYVNRNAEKIIKHNRDTLNEVIDHCLRIKANIVKEDENEKGTRAFLNLGHTFGHAIEEITQYKRYSHGEAVAIGIICACYLAEELDIFKPGHTDSVVNLMEKLGLEYRIPVDLDVKQIIHAFKYDKKNEAGKVKFILPSKSIGKVEIVTGVDNKLIKKALLRNQIKD